MYQHPSHRIMYRLDESEYDWTKKSEKRFYMMSAFSFVNWGMS